jgi:hypothetical protein
MSRMSSPDPIDYGETWCERCRRFHKNNPPGYNTEEEMLKKVTAEMAQEIDNKIIAELMKKTKRKR